MALEGVLIRLAEASDLDSLETLLQGHLSSFDKGYWQTRFQKQGIFTYLVEDKAVFGFVTAGEGELMEDVGGAPTGELVGLFVSPAYRGNGLGKKLMVRGLGVLKRRGFERALTFISGPSKEAQALLRSLGFVEAGSVRELNVGGKVLKQTGYEADLASYF